MLDKAYAGTPVCHYYTKEWLEMGYNVKVVHFPTRFPKFYYLAGVLFGDKIKARTGNVVYTKIPRKPSEYIIDNIPVLYIPLYKFIPHTQFSEKVMNKAANHIFAELEKQEFVPDIITGHFALPQLQFIDILKRRYTNASTCMVLHSNGSTIPKIYSDYKTYFESVDVWGFRSEAFRQDFESQFGKRDRSFICYSGIPEEYLKIKKKKDFSNGITKFSFLGSLFKLKRVEDSLRALKNEYNQDDFHFDIIGDGAERKNLESLVEELDIKNNVEFHGQLDRNRAQELLEESQCFIMASSREAFGLVYVEAMAKGCITIGTKGQGIDGVIKHGENGFLCEAYNVEELSGLIEHIRKLSEHELERISNNAIETAKNLTDKKVAEHYINSVINAK